MILFSIQRTQQCWAVWLQHCEHCEEIKLGPKTRTARGHHAIKLKRMVVGAWLQYKTRRVERKKQYSIADQHFKSAALPKYGNISQNNYGVIVMRVWGIVNEHGH